MLIDWGVAQVKLTKWLEKVAKQILVAKELSDEISGYLRATFERIGINYGVELVEWNYDKDHVHVLFKCTPPIALLNSLIHINQLVQD